MEGGIEAQGEKRCLGGCRGRRKGEMGRRENRGGREGEGGVSLCGEGGGQGDRGRRSGESESLTEW